MFDVGNLYGLKNILTTLSVSRNSVLYNTKDQIFDNLTFFSSCKKANFDSVVLFTDKIS